MQLQVAPKSLAERGEQGGLAVRTGLRGGVCVDVNDQVKAALQTLTDALGGSAAATVSATPTESSATSS